MKNGSTRHESRESNERVSETRMTIGKAPASESAGPGGRGDLDRLGPWSHESWVDSLTREALQQVNRALIVVADMAHDLEPENGAAVDEKDVERVARSLRLVRKNLRIARRNHVRPLLQRVGQREQSAPTRREAPPSHEEAPATQRTRTDATTSTSRDIDDAAHSVDEAIARLDDTRKDLDAMYCEIPSGDENPVIFSEIVNWLYMTRRELGNAQKHIAAAREERGALPESADGMAEGATLVPHTQSGARPKAARASR